MPEVARPLGASRRPLVPWPRVVFALACALAVAGEIFVMCVRETGVPSTQRDEGARLLGEVAGPVAVTQTIRLETAGFKGVTLEAGAFHESVSGDVVFTLTELSTDAAGSRREVVQVTAPARNVVKEESYRLDFSPIEESAGKRYELRIEAPAAPAGQGLGLWVTRDQAYVGGAAALDGRGQWGDVVFRVHTTSATFFQRFERLLRNQPEVIRSRVTLAAAFFLYNWSLVAFAWRMLFAQDKNADQLERPAWLSLVRSTVVVLAAVAVLLAVVASVGRARQGPGDDGTIDLLRRFPDADIRTTMPSLEEGFALQTVVIGGEAKPSLFAHPTSRVTWVITVPPRAVLRAFAALRPDVWESPGDGALLRIGISDGTAHAELFARMIQPSQRPEDRRWFPVEVDLSAYAGRQVQVIFETAPGDSGNAVGDAAVWGAPQVVSKP